MVFTAGDLVEGLEYLDPQVRRAILFGLETHLSPAAVSELTFREAAHMRLSEVARRIVAVQPQHFRIPYVFWIEVDGFALPILDLERQVCGAFGGMSWLDLTIAYENMVMVDENADHDDFCRQFYAA